MKGIDCSTKNGLIDKQFFFLHTTTTSYNMAAKPPPIHPNAMPYRPRKTDNEDCFDSFLAWAKAAPLKPVFKSFAIQMVCHPNFQASQKEISWFTCEPDGTFMFTGDTPKEIVRANSFKNFKTAKGTGHPNGIFYEVNL